MKNTLFSANRFFNGAKACFGKKSKLVEAVALASAYCTVNTANMLCVDDPWFSQGTTTTVSPPTSIGTLIAKFVNFMGNTARIAGVIGFVISAFVLGVGFWTDNSTNQSKAAIAMAVCFGFIVAPTIFMGFLT